MALWAGDSSGLLVRLGSLQAHLLEREMQKVLLFSRTFFLLANLGGGVRTMGGKWPCR